MKKLRLFLCLSVFCGFLSAGETFAQQSAVSKAEPLADWSALFPEIPGCERTIFPLTRNDGFIQQSAAYRPKINNDDRVWKNNGCGTIELKFIPGIRAAVNLNYAERNKNPFNRKRKVKTFDAYTVTPWCGNDLTKGTTTVYFDDNMVLTVSAKRGVGDLQEFAERADYELIRQTIDRFVKSIN